MVNLQICAKFTGVSEGIECNVYHYHHKTNEIQSKSISTINILLRTFNQNSKTSIAVKISRL